MIDATDDNNANLALGYATAVVGGFSQDVQVDWMRRQRLPHRSATPPLSIEFRTWYNEELESRNFITASGRSEVIAIARDEVELAELIGRRQATIAIQIRFGFAQQLRQGVTAPVQLIVDGTNSTTALM